MTDSLMINADDFGWTDGQTLAVERAYRCGSLRRASLLSNGAAFTEAVELAAILPELHVGAHLTLNEGRPLIQARFLPNLVSPKGEFFDEITSLARLWVSGRLHTAEVMAEWRAQIERPLKAGLVLSHLDSHKHIHLFPPLLETIVALAKEYRIHYVRLPLEAWNKDSLRRGPQGLVLWALALRARPLLHAAGLVFADHFIGISLSGKMVGEHLRHVWEHPQTGLTEIMMHPAVITPAVKSLQKRYRWARRYHFKEELDALCT